MMLYEVCTLITLLSTKHFIAAYPAGADIVLVDDGHVVLNWRAKNCLITVELNFVFDGYLISLKERERVGALRHISLTP